MRDATAVHTGASRRAFCARGAEGKCGLTLWAHWGNSPPARYPFCSQQWFTKPLHYRCANPASVDRRKSPGLIWQGPQGAGPGALGAFLRAALLACSHFCGHNAKKADPAHPVSPFLGDSPRPHPITLPRRGAGGICPVPCGEVAP